MIYLDNAATTYPKYYGWDWSNYWLNSNAPYACGSKTMLDEARERIKEALGVKSGKVLFCRSATEAVEWLCNRLPKFPYETVICCSPYEHDSAENAIKVATFNKATTKIPKDCDVYLQQHTNQITGEIFNVVGISEEVWATTDHFAFFGSDFTATIGHSPIPENLDTFCDAIWFSGHKFHVEKGIGAIWLSDRLFKYLSGSEDSRNEYGLIHGTVNAPAAIALSYGMMDAVRWYEAHTDHYPILASHLYGELTINNILYKMVPADTNKRYSYAINAITLPSINADALQACLASKQIYIGVGHSACADVADYRVLKAYGLSDEDCECTIRVSFSPDTSKAEITELVKAIKEFKEKYL